MIKIFNMIALGQCGCRITQEFDKMGFKACYINSDSVDMRNIDVPKDKILMLSTSGSGRSPQKGKAILNNNFDKFTSFMDENLDKNNLNVFVIGFGGGTGGGMIEPSIDYVLNKGYKVGLIATLPPKLSGMLDMDNAMRGLKRIKDKNLSLFILCDNEYLIDRVGLSSNWWQKINYYIFMKISTCFDILRDNKTSQSGVGSIDRGELLRILQYGKGMFDIHDVYFTIPEELHLSDDELKKRLFEPALVAGYNYRDALFYMVSVDIPKKGGYTEFTSRIFNITKSVYGSALSRIGMFNDPVIDNVVRVTMISAGLKMPKILRSRLNNLRRDSERHTQKKVKEDLLDFSPIDDIQIDDDFELD